MTHSDFIASIGRYCHRLVSSNVNPTRIYQIRATLNDFLRALNQDMEDNPLLFEHPHWGSRVTDPQPPSRAERLRQGLDCIGGPGSKVSLPTPIAPPKGQHDV